MTSSLFQTTQANVLEHNDTFLHAPYTTVDVTPYNLKHGTVLAVVGMAPLYQTPCNLHVCKDPNTDGGGILAQLVLTYTDGTKEVVTTGGNAWQAKVGRISTPTPYSHPFL